MIFVAEGKEKMPKYIDADAFERHCMFNGDINDMQDVIYALRDYPAVDVRENVKGEWMKDSDVAFYWKCSECGAYVFWNKENYLLRNTDELNFCPNCGAEMGDEENG